MLLGLLKKLIHSKIMESPFSLKKRRGKRRWEERKKGKEQRKGDRRTVGKEEEKGNISGWTVSPFLESQVSSLQFPEAWAMGLTICHLASLLHVRLLNPRPSPCWRGNSFGKNLVKDSPPQYLGSVPSLRRCKKDIDRLTTITWKKVLQNSKVKGQAASYIISSLIIHWPTNKVPYEW